MIRSLLVAGFGCALLASCAPTTVVSRCESGGAHQYDGCLGAGAGDSGRGTARRAEPTRVAEGPVSRPDPAPGRDPVGPGDGGAAPAGDGGSGAGGDPGPSGPGPTDGPGDGGSGPTGPGDGGGGPTDPGDGGAGPTDPGGGQCHHEDRPRHPGKDKNKEKKDGKGKPGSKQEGGKKGKGGKDKGAKDKSDRQGNRGAAARSGQS